MPRGEKSKYTAKQERKADHIAEGYEKRGVSQRGCGYSKARRASSGLIGRYTKLTAGSQPAAAIRSQRRHRIDVCSAIEVDFESVAFSSSRFC